MGRWFDSSGRPKIVAHAGLSPALWLKTTATTSPGSQPGDRRLGPCTAAPHDSMQHMANDNAFNADRHMTARDCARLAGFSRQRWAQLVGKGKAPAALEGVIWPMRVWDRQAVEEWVDGRRAGR